MQPGDKATVQEGCVQVSAVNGLRSASLLLAPCLDQGSEECFWIRGFQRLSGVFIVVTEINNTNRHKKICVNFAKSTQ